MNDNQREMLMTCLTQIFGRVEDAFVDAVAPVLRWIELSGGDTLFEQGDPEDGVYLVISGRLRALVDDGNGQRHAVNEIMRGETIGEMAVLTHEPRSATIVAVRDSVLAQVSRESFDALLRKHPELAIHMSRVVIGRLKRSGQARRAARPVTICVLPVTDGVDAHAIAEDLGTRLARWGVTAVETSARIDQRFGRGASQATPAEPDLYHRLTLWLDDVEFWNETVLFVADPVDSEWTRRCIRHADEILLLARSDAPPARHPLEEKYLSGPAAITGARQTLVLLHDEAERHPRDTPAWLAPRTLSGHLHVRPTRSRDMQRLARILSGNGIGLVLAGGGARGFAHLGVLKALEEEGISVDLVGGTSIGAAMAGLASFDQPADTLIAKARKAFSRGPTGDYNLLPLISLIRGRRLRSVIEDAVVDTVGFRADATDSWRSFFCVATNFSRASEMVLDRGDIATCIRASVSIPVALPPVILDGNLLVDGGTFNNFPTDVMARAGAGRIIGVDLAREKSRVYEYPEVPSPWELFLDRFRKKRRYRLPTLAAIMMETTILYSTSRQGVARRAVDLYMRPDLGRIGLLDWGAFDRIVKIGYAHAKDVLASMPPELLAQLKDEEPAAAAEAEAATAL
jgi:NTE family protein